MGHGQCGGSSESALLVPIFCSMITVNYVKVLTINHPDSRVRNNNAVTSVAISPDGQFVAAGSLDTVIWIWDVATGILVEQLQRHKDSVYSVTFTPDGKGLISGSLDKTLKFWDVSELSVSNAKRKDGPRGSGSNATGPGTLGQGAVMKNGSPCTVNFTGHSVRLTFFVFFIKPSELIHHLMIVGLCPFCCRFARWTMDRLRFQRPWSPVLGC
jgi:WD40 repeat protein